MHPGNCPCSQDDSYAAEFISGIVRSDTVHRELRTADLLAIARKVRRYRER